MLVQLSLRFRDLDRNGILDPYEDWRLSPKRRAADLVARMTLVEKAGAMLHPVMDKPEQVTAGHITSVLSRASARPEALAEQNNAFQEAAEGTRLGIPVTISTDPRNGFTATFGTSVDSAGFSQWPDMPGIGATRDLELARRFGDVARQEHRAVGFTMALGPQADIATDPRWSRTSGTFGDNPRLVGQLAAAYVEGIQGSVSGVTRSGVSAIIKHYAGYGAVKDGWDSHSRYGRFATFPGGRLEDHIAAFRPSFDAHVAGVMPTYSILEAPGMPPVAAGFSKPLLQDILRDREGYRGLVLSDWSITENCTGPCVGGAFTGDRAGIVGKPWGVEALSRAERIEKAIDAGIDQIGYDAAGRGEDSSPIVDAVEAGRISMARIDEAVRRIMAVKFEVGLFENPYVDPAAATRVVGQSAFQQAASEAQRRSLVLLQNKGRLLPLKPAGKRVFLRGVAPSIAERFGFVVVDSPEKADLAIIRAVTPWQLVHPDYIFGRLQHEGDADFKPDNKDLEAIRKATKAGLPTIVTVYLERPAILTNVRSISTALVGNFGTSDEALLDLVIGKARFQGKLPFELPSSVYAANAQLPDVAHDSAKPLYRSGLVCRTDAGT